MGYLIKNNIQFFGNNSIPLTQAQYDAMVEAGTVDPNAIYYITDRSQACGDYAAGVTYDNTESGLSANNVQDAIDEVVDLAGENIPASRITYDNSTSELDATNVQTAIDEVIDRIYPVGSIYMSVTDSTVAQVEARFGGTWEAFGAGKTLVGVDANDTSFDTVEETGGTKSTSYTPTGSNSGTAVTMSAVTLTHSGGAVGNHTLVESELPKISGYWGIHGQENGTIFYTYSGHCTGTTIRNTYKSPSATTGAYSLRNPGFSFGGGASHNHGFTQPSQHSFTPTTSAVTNPTFTGTAANISTVQPYITCYMYKRTA